ncbi:sigma-54-dependent Fis family transcriptional regulator [Thiolapillus brandeum]|uniref:Fis family transcriptional regulator n=1 Tax=Thiolapillus brandeum TaxID=1076588 RepID=A0A7U6JGU2_9GAMM|nr:sigma-54-dependent Fis family transcriptional regulator [Thiolapillus brandeum]BAO43869.1 Fis family transcriptional regulator [Thiolapillus brandeum]
MTLPSMQDLKDKILFEDDKGCIWLGENRMLLLHAASFGALRKELIDSIGWDRASAMLMRMGFNSGTVDAQLARQTRPEATIEEMFAVGPQLHALEGIVHVKPVKLELDIGEGRFHGEFIWENSVEAEEHIRSFGKEDHPVCWNLAGYASGFSSAFMHKTILYKEVECVGQGDACCRIVGKPIEEWDRADEIHRMLVTDSMSETIELLRDELDELKSSCREVANPENIIGDSPAMQEALKLLRVAAESDVTVLMLGETGVGKEVFSNALQQMSKRHEKPFVAVNCAALPKDLVEAELFGVEKGAFTGAEKSRPGRFERADGGVLFLDEIGELSERAQAKLLRVLQTGEVERVGGTNVRKVDVRLIAATNKDLGEMVSESRFRADLFYRLNIFPITIPPLRERLEDLPKLVEKFITRNNAKHGKQVMGATDLVMDWFRRHPWPGNIRELENVIERGVLLAPNGKCIDTTHLFPCMEPDEPSGGTGLSSSGALVDKQDTGVSPLDALIGEGLSLDQIEQLLMERVLQETEGNVSAAARLLQVGDAQFRYRMKKHGITKGD